MRTKTFLIATLLSLVVTGAFAQRGSQQGRKGQNKPCERACVKADLSEEQQESIEKAKLVFIKATQADRNQLNELQAKKHTIQTTSPYNKKDMEKVLSEINKIHASMLKEKVRHGLAVKSFLNDEQVVAFDNRAFDMHKKRGGKQFDNRGKQGKGKGQRNRSEYAQKSRRNGECKLGIDDELKESMKTAHVDLMKQQQPLLNKANELEAQLKSATNGKSFDVKKADKIIDQLSGVKLDIAKLNANAKADMRSQLTEEQRVMLDHRMMGKGKSKHRGMYGIN